MAGVQAAPPESAALMRALAAHPEQMADLIEALHRRALDADMLLELLGRVGRAAVRLADGIGWAGVTAQFDGPPLTASHTDGRVLIVDERQYSVQDGPCLRAMRSGRTVAMTVADMDAVWPLLAETARTAGVLAVLAVPLFANGRFVGALNMYSPAEVVPHPDADVLTVLTEYAGRGLSDFQNTNPEPTPDEVLRRALAGWVEVERAVEVLMKEYECDVDYAREVLADQAEDWGRTLSDQAAHVISANMAPD